MARRSCGPNLGGWISEEEAQTNFIDHWRLRKVIPHKYSILRFFRREGFIFQEWLERQRLKTFVEMDDQWYPDLLKKEFWTSIVGFHPRGEKTYLGIEGMHKFVVYQDCLGDPNQARDYSLYRTGEMKRDYCLCAFVIAWILLPRGDNHAQLTTEDVCIIHLLKENIQTNWETSISDNMIKLTRLEATSLPYVVFVFKVHHYFHIDCVEESCETYGKRNVVDKIALHHMGLRHGVEGWTFKDENHVEEEAPIGSSSASIRPKS
ncbi:hypothetical protein LR48_Vigan08g102300 [Vigna angularis]|uniref:Aminotransferase-like plant mobile domain-containing protein n=1 Tax=Phaseolus angularis TaxID=3914 RepID=A0A0L9V5A2_PHAAN|nr:hypothetical protein LR48_Vigan08g102300 [Vigna angularis]